MNATYIPWVEKYRPMTLDEVREHEDAISKIKELLSSGDIPHMIFEGQPGTGKTSTAGAMVNDLYKDIPEEILRNCVKELNASDARGINTVRTEIKEFNKAKKNPRIPFKILILDEADDMTNPAMQALRRTMEQYTHNCRMILICNYSNKIIPPIQSRCATIHFDPLTKEGIKAQVRYVADKEDVKITDEAIDTLAEIAYGDMRKAINNLQASSLLNIDGSEITEKDIHDITGTVDKEVIGNIIDTSMNGNLHIAVDEIDKLLKKGASGKEIAIQMFMAVRDSEKIDDVNCALVSSLVSDAIYNITIGCSEKIQLRGLVAGIHEGRLNG